MAGKPGIRERLGKWLVGKSGGSIEEWFASYGFSGASSTGLHVNQLTALQTSAVMACVSIRSEDVAKLPLHVYRRLRNGGKKIVTNHPVERLLQRPNEWQTRFEFVEQMQAARLLRGNAYAAKVRNGRGIVTSLVPINPDLVWLYESPAGDLFYQVARNTPHMMAVLNSLPNMIPAEDMLHIRWMSTNSLLGLSPIALARESIGLSLSQQEQAARLAGNGSRPGGVLQTDKKLSPDVIARLKTSWGENYSGVSNTGKTAVLEEGLKWQALGMTSADAEFLASRKFQVEEIARIYRMPGHKLGLVDRSTNATMEQADQDYMNNVVSGDLERWEPKLNDEFGLADEGLFAEFDISRALRASIQVRYTAYRTGIIGSFLTINEVRAGEGLPAVEGGDTILQPTNMVPLGFEPTSPGSGLGSDTTGAPAAGGDGDGAAVPSVPDDSAPAG